MPITICKDENGRPCKRNGLQKYRVRVSYTVYAADGSPTYKELERTAYGKLQAQELETKLLAQAADATKRSADAPETVGDLAEEYLRRLLASKTIRESSHEKKKSIQNNHILPTLRNAKISKLNAQVLMEWQDNMNAKEIGLAMKRNAYAELRALLNYAVKCEYLPANPLSKIDNFKDVNVSEHPEEAIHMGSFPIKVGKGENGGCLEQSSRRFLYAIRCVSVLQGHFVFLFLIIRAFLDSLQGSR